MPEVSPEELFAQDGFVRIDAFYSPDQVGELLDNTERYIRDVVPTVRDVDVFYEDKGQPDTLKQLIRLNEHDNYFRDLLEHGPLPMMASTLLDEGVRPITQQIFIKPPGGKSKATPPHQDGFYFHIEPVSALTLWLALDDIDEENGCLRFVRRSHAKGIRQHERTQTLGFSQGLPDFGQPEDVADEVVCTARAGDLIVHHALTVHHASDNRAADRQRRALGQIYFGESAKDRTAEQIAYKEQLNADLRKLGRV